MLLLFLVALLLAAGLALVLGMSHQGRARSTSEWLRSVGFFVVTLSLLGLLQLVLPLPLAWMVSSLGLGALTYSAIRGRTGSLTPILIPVALAGVMAHLSVALFDVAMSVVEVESDAQLVEAALNRAMSGGNLVLLVLLVLLLLAAATVGYVLGSRDT